MLNIIQKFDNINTIYNLQQQQINICNYKSMI